MPTKVIGYLACIAFFAMASSAVGKKGETRVLVDSFVKKAMLRRKTPMSPFVVKRIIWLRGNRMEG